MVAESNYIPGMCNINPAEIRRRRMTGILGTSAAIIVTICLLYYHAAWPYFLVLFALLFIGRLGILQAEHKFCAAYATIGKHHADNNDIQSIDNSNAHKADIKKARKLYIKAFFTALILTVLIYIVSLF